MRMPKASRKELALLKARKCLGIKLDGQYFLIVKFCYLGGTIVELIKSALPRMKNRQSKFWGLLPFLNIFLSSEEVILIFCNAVLYENGYLPI